MTTRNTYRGDPLMSARVALATGTSRGVGKTLGVF